MKIKEYAKTKFDLKNESIDEFSDWLTESLGAIKTEKCTILKIRILLEEILLRDKEQFGEEVELSARLEGSFRHIYVRLELAGDAFNPLSETNAELGDWNSSLQTAVGITPKYSYSWGKNVLKVKVPGKKMNPVLLIFLAILIGVLLGLAGNYILGEPQQQLVNTYFLTPAYELWIRMLNAISGPIVFFTVITTMLNTKRIDKQGGNSSNVVMRYFGFSFIIATSGVLISIPFFLSKEAIQPGSGIGQKILGYLREMVPSNIIEPFLTANTPQLIVTAFVIGAAVIVLASRVNEVKTILRQINMVGLKLAEWVSMLVPVFAGLFLCLEIIQGKIIVLRGIYKPLLLSVVAALTMMLLAVGYVSLKMRVKMPLIGKKIQAPFFTALRTGSLDASFEQTKHSCIRLLGVDKGYTNISLPQGLVLYMPVSAIGTLVFTMYSAQVYGVKVDLFWLISAIIFAVVLFVATPPVPGANLLAYVVFFNWLGIPSEALMDAMIFDIVFGILAGAGNQLLLQIEMILQADKIGILNKKILKEPLPQKSK